MVRGGATQVPIFLCASDIFRAVGVVDTLLPPGFTTDILLPDPDVEIMEIFLPGAATENLRPMGVWLQRYKSYTQ